MKEKLDVCAAFLAIQPMGEKQIAFKDKHLAFFSMQFLARRLP